MPNSVSHEIRIDRARKLVDVRLRGFFTPEDAGWISEEVRAAILTLGEDVGKHVTLYDATHVRVAPAETIEAVRASFASPAVRPLWARRIAYVATSALLRRQLARITDAHPALRVFGSRAEALAWLLEA